MRNNGESSKVGTTETDIGKGRNMPMKRFAMTALILSGLMATLVQGQELVQPVKGSESVSTEQEVRGADVRTRRGMALSSLIAYGSFSLGGEDRFGPMMILQYSPNPRSVPAIDLFGGILFQTGTSGTIDTREYIPIASYFAPYYSPFSNYRNDYLYDTPRFSIGLAFLGADATFYLLDGEVRPYVGIGGALALWSYTNRLNGTLAPDAKAGLEIRVSNTFSGFAEVRRMFGVPNLFGLDTPKFDGLTSAAIGISFAPRLR